jgi:hypothetical protein
MSYQSRYREASVTRSAVSMYIRNDVLWRFDNYVSLILVIVAKQLLFFWVVPLAIPHPKGACYVLHSLFAEHNTVHISKINIQCSCHVHLLAYYTKKLRLGIVDRS